MDARSSPIVGRNKAIEVSYPAVGDFSAGEAEPVSPRIVLDEAGWSPYAIDAERQEVAFVRLPAGTDLAVAAFAYIEQYRHADRLLIMPLASVLELAERLPLPKAIWIFSMGRCGTTLASHALNGSDVVWSLSEPGVFDFRGLEGLRNAGADPSAAIAACVKLFFARRPQAERTVLSIKLRSQGIFNAELFRAATPQSRSVFMYRDALGWVNSFYHFIQSLGVPDELDHDVRDFTWGFISGDRPLAVLGRYADLDLPTTGFDRIFAVGWIIHLEAYLRALQAGTPFLALRYNEFNAQREASVRALFHHCALPESGVARALEAFGRDSQEGTVIERREGRKTLTPDNASVVRSILARSGTFADPDLILPDAYTP